jgi:hypothetical protein
LSRMSYEPQESSTGLLGAVAGPTPLCTHFEGDIILPNEIPFLRHEHPTGTYIVFLRNLPEKRHDIIFLTMQIVFDAPSLNEAKEVVGRLTRWISPFSSPSECFRLLRRERVKAWYYMDSKRRRPLSDLRDQSTIVRRSG